MYVGSLRRLSWFIVVSSSGVGISQSVVCKVRSARTQASRLTAVPKAPGKVCNDGLLTAWTYRGVWVSSVRLWFFGSSVLSCVWSLKPGGGWGCGLFKQSCSSTPARFYMVHQETKG